MYVELDDACDALDLLALRSEVESLLLGGLDLGKFIDYFEEPDGFYDQDDWDGHWDERNVLPLWQHQGSIYACDLAKDPKQYISFYLEFPDEIEEYGTSLDVMLFHMIYLHVWEYGGEEQEAAEALEFAEKLKMPYLDELRSLLNRWDTCPQEEIEAYKARLSGGQ